MKIFKASFKYIFIFTFTLFVLVVFGIYANNWDSLWNYGFSYSIAKGQIPYNDFTMIVQPLYNYIMSIGLILVSHNNIVFLLEQAILVSINFYFLYKVFDYKVWLIIVVMCFPMFIAFSPTYNYFIFFLFTIVLYLEHKNKNDYLIGFILGLIILTKAVVGIFFVIPTLIYYFNDKKKIFKRFIGLIIPCIVFIIYLLCNNSIKNFINLCILGIFDFGKNNTDIMNWQFIISIIMFIISIIFTIKQRNKILNYYIMCSFIIILPNCSDYHYYLYIVFFSLLLISQDIKINKKITLIFSFIMIGLITLFHLNQIISFRDRKLKVEVYKEINNFNYYINYKNTKHNLINTNKLYNELKVKGQVHLISYTGDLFLKIINEEKTDYFTILNKGNYGYNGTNNMKKRVKNMKNTYFIINKDNYYYSKTKQDGQFDYDLVKFIMDSSKKIDNKYGYDIYYKE